MWKQFIISCRMMIAMTFILGVVYPFAVTGVSQTVSRMAARGSLIEREGKIVGSKLIAQKFAADKYFHSRPSAVDYNGLSSGGSNLSLNAKKLKEQRDARPNVPSDLVYASGSGLDPHITVAAAEYQLDRVANARSLSKTKVTELVRENTERKQFAFLGEDRVNVLLLNLALDKVNERR
jgi:K+-transporting ATPase ATPase C chain